MSKISKDMGIIDVIQNYPETIEVFQKYGFGCIGCAAARFEKGIDEYTVECGMARALNLCQTLGVAKISSSSFRYLFSYFTLSSYSFFISFFN